MVNDNTEEYESKILSMAETESFIEKEKMWKESEIFQFDTKSKILNSAKKLECSSERLTGVYFLFNEEKIVYIGQSNNILYRIGNHVYYRDKDFDSVYYIECSECLLNELEKHYIRQFSPKYNR